MPDDRDALNAETRARRSLGLAANSPSRQQQRVDQARPRHRFVRDGEVPVVVLSGNGKSDASAAADSRIADLEHALEAGRAAHALTARSLEEAQATIQSLQTRLAHTEMASDEALAAERRARAEAEKALQEAITGGRTEDQQEDDGSLAEPGAKSPQGKRVRRATTTAKPTATRKEPQPVKWWTTSYKAKRNKS